MWLLRHTVSRQDYSGPILEKQTENSSARKDSFLCAALGTKISIAFTKKIGVGFFGGEGFILRKLNGDGMVFIHAGGTVVGKTSTMRL